jgi:predicted dehydrogenase
MGMVGGGRDAFIGAVHRRAAELDGEIQFVAGALSSTPDKSLASGRDLDLTDDRIYPTWQAMLDGELARPECDRIDLVSIVTPNHVHFEVAKAFADAGIHVVCDKPLTPHNEDADELVRTVEAKGVVFCVTYNYTGYPMIKQARAMIRDGALGTVRKVIVEYLQGWLADKLEDSGQKQAGWRTDPAKAGAGAVGDIGSHAEQLTRYVTGLDVESISANVNTFVEGRPIDDDVSVFMKLSKGARGVLSASQVCVGNQNDLVFRVWGTKAGLEWHQEEPNKLILRSNDGPDQIFYRGVGYVGDEAQAVTRIPSGHPEGFHEAFANIYRAAAAAIRVGRPDATEFDYPDVRDGARGVKFINAVLESGRNDGAWTTVD